MRLILGRLLINHYIYLQDPLVRSDPVWVPRDK